MEDHPELVGIEVLLRTKLGLEFTAEKSSEMFEGYRAARKKVLVNDSPYCKGDHSVEHVQDLFEKMHAIVGPEAKGLSAIQLYMICLAGLFHEIGTLECNKSHKLSVSKAYDDVRQGNWKYSQERSALISVISANSGFCKQVAGEDLLKKLQDHGLFDQRVNLRPVGAILRFADELLSSPKRTNRTVSVIENAVKDPQIIERINEVMDLTVDREHERICGTCSIRLELDENGDITDEKVSLNALLQGITERISRLNQERKYCSFYSSCIGGFKEISVDFEFVFDGDYLDHGIGPLILNDLVVPGQLLENVCEPKYSVDKLMTKIQNSLTEPNPPESLAFETDDEFEP